MKKVNELTNSPPPDSTPGGASLGGSDMMDMIRSMVSPGENLVVYGGASLDQC